MKKKIIYIIFIFIAFLLIPTKVHAASPEATLTSDGVLVGNYASVQEAVNAITMTAGSNFVVEIAAGEVSDPLKILQIANKSVVVRPQVYGTVTFTNTITIDGNGNLASPETLLLEGLIFDFSAGTFAECIYFNLIPPRVGFVYAHNVTINGCTFMGVLDQTVAVQSIPGGMRNISIMNSTATNMHSLLQVKAVSGYMFVQNVTLDNSTNGINFYGTANLFIDSSNLNVTGYAVRSGQGAGVITNTGSVTINNSILTSNTMTDGTVVLRGDTTSNVSIIHSNVSNNAGAGAPAVQNLNAASVNLYNLKIVESNINGEIENISKTIRIVDDPNVENGPICVNNNNGGNTITIVLIFIILILLIPLTIMSVYIVYNTEVNITDMLA